MTRPIVMDIIARDNASKTFKSVAQSQQGLAKQTDGLSKNNDNLRKSQLQLVAAQERYNKVAQSGKATAGQLASAQSSLITAHQRVRKATDDTSTSTKRFGQLSGLAYTAVGLAAVSFARGVIQAARDQQKANAQTAAVIKSTGGAANVTTKQVGDLAGSLSKLTGIQDDVIQSGENMLLTFTNIRNETGKGNDVFNQATKVVTDMSVALGQDMKTSAIQVGKALNDPIKGLTALTRVGVTFTQQQKDQIKQLVATGNVMGAQKVILAELNKEFGGSAAAQATAADKAAASWSQFQESIGNVVLPVLDRFLSVATSIIDTIGKYAPILVPLGVTLGVFAAAVWAVNAATKAWAASQTALVSVLGATRTAALLGVIGPLAAAAATFGALYIGAGLLTKAISGTDEAMIKAGSRGIKDFTTSLQKSGGVFDTQTQKILASTLVTGGYADKAKKAGITVDQLTRGVTGNDAAMQSLVETWRASGAPSEQTIGSLRRIHENFQKATEDGLKNAAATVQNNQAQVDLSKSMAASTDQIGRQSLFLADNNLTVDQAKQKYNDAVAAAHSFSAELGYMSNALQTLSGNNITATLQQDQLNLAMGTAADNFAGARAQVAEHGKALQGNTADAISNRGWALQQIQAINQQAISYAQATGSIDKGTGALGTNIAALRRSMEQAGFTKAQIDKLIDTYAATPSDVETSIREQGSQAVLAALGDILNQLHAIADPVWGAKFDFAMNNPSLSRGFARGGQVQGPGGPTADMIPARLSAGEYVVNARSTAKFLPMLESINRNKYAAGGLVGELNVNTTGLSAEANQFAGVLFKTLRDTAAKNREELAKSAGIPGNFPGSILDWVIDAVNITGTPASWIPAILRRINFESGGNPNAINLTDTNAQAGDPSRGLMQTIGATFNAYHQAGTSSNIYDPVANVAAAINYIKSRYGSIFAIDPPVQGYRVGAWEVASNQLAGLHKGEMVLPADIAELVRSGAGKGLSPRAIAAAVAEALAGMEFRFDGDGLARLVTRKQTAYAVRGGRR